MSDDERKSPDLRRPSEPEALLEDLESIRDLLDAEREIPMRGTPKGEITRGEVPPGGAPKKIPVSTSTDDDIPVLREIVREGLRPQPPSSAEQPSDRAELQTDLFDARMFADGLLDETWQQQSNAILASARRTADALTAKLAPEASATARERLRSRLANELPPLIEQMVGEALDELQERLLGVLRNELTRLTEATLTERPQPSGPDDEPSNDD